MISAVKDLDMETCVTLGMLTPTQATRLAGAGLDFYNHNVDTSPEFYSKIVTTRTLQDRIDTLLHVREAGIKVALSEWARGSKTGSACWCYWPICRAIRKAFRSTYGMKSRVCRSVTGPSDPIRSRWFAWSRPPGS
ncbi:hypothetical protein GCM10007857_83780 [Bradyrhizobium iriomotense]|uniref:Radical SAM core domain-containing protein n=1 Tax=Bradyrhizobium iriomotense TaxID=441950 RepID=A0ABQ6BFD0_9BRAD|nr:hypothetical protein GCM10007857_83780 [Bradyrhizobium iriomotense]